MSKDKAEKKEKVSGKEMKKESDKKITDLVAAMRKQFGDGALFHGDMPIQDVETTSTGSLILDVTLGIGGFPRGRIVEIYGPESSGKTTIALHALASGQRAGHTCAFIDAEHALDPKYAKKLGVKVNEMIISQPDNGEQALDIAVELANSGAIQMMVIDSVAALVPKVELEGDMEKSNVGLQARMMSKALRKLTGICQKNNVILIFINQIRLKIGVMFGDPRTTTGGEALKYYASMRLTVSAGEKVKDGDRIIGGKMKVKVIKNKMAPPFTECEIPVIYGEGFDKVGDIFAVAKAWNILEQKGNSYFIEGEKIASKRDDAIAALKSDDKLRERLEKMVRSELKKRMEAGNLENPEPSAEDLAEAKEEAPSDDE